MSSRWTPGTCIPCAAHATRFITLDTISACCRSYLIVAVQVRVRTTDHRIYLGLSRRGDCRRLTRVCCTNRRRRRNDDLRARAGGRGGGTRPPRSVVKIRSLHVGGRPQQTPQRSCAAAVLSRGRISRAGRTGDVRSVKRSDRVAVRSRGPSSSWALEFASPRRTRRRSPFYGHDFASSGRRQNDATAGAARTGRTRTPYVT